MALEKRYAWSVLLRVYHWTLVVSIGFLAVTGFYIHVPWTNTTLMRESSFTMANMRYVHFLAAQFFACALLIRFYLLLFGNRAERILNFAPLTVRNLKKILPGLKYYLYCRDNYEPLLGHGVVAGIFYCITFIFGIIVTLSGFYLLYPESHFYQFMGIMVFESQQYARFIHHISMWYFLFFAMVHLYFVVWNDMSYPEGTATSMIDGYQFVEAPSLELEEEIKERERVETDLLSEKERLAVTLRNIRDGVITTDVYGNVILINKVAEELTGWSQEEALGRSLREVFQITNEKTGKPCKNPVEQVFATGQITDLGSYSLLTDRNRKRKSITYSCAPVRGQHSEIIGVVLAFKDVTEQRRMEQELFKVEKLESVGVLAGGIAHDFNNILAAILGNVNLALDYCDPDDQLYGLLSEVEKASLRARGLTQQLLTFAKGGEPVKRAASITSVIKDSADFVLHGSNVRCDYFFDDDLWLVEIDSGQMSQVIQNIIINAKEAMPEGGVIEVTCRNLAGEKIHILSLEKGDYVEVAIKDQGIGISDSQIDKIFDPYFTTKQAGSGLGLAITHSIISKHGGRISVESGKDKGVAFYIYLPAHREKEEEIPVEGRGERVRAKGKIMVMDDEELVRDVAFRMLTYLGYEVILAEDGEEAVLKYRDAMDSSEPVDLVIMDLTIPGGMGGREAIGELHQIDPRARAVVSSGYSNDPVLAHYCDYGFSATMVKPFRLKELDDLLADLLL
ncbi:MAG: ATP-binding protein [Thermodesulfobacteriota bacterium]